MAMELQESTQLELEGTGEDVGEEMDENEVIVPFRHITELADHGINQSDINKLIEAGFCTVESVSTLLLSC